MGMLPANESEITASWLTAALREGGALERGDVIRFASERVGEGIGLLGRLARLRIEYDGADATAPPTVIAKFPTEIPENLEIARIYGFYDRECNFYEKLSDKTPLRVPHCYYQTRRAVDSFVLLLEDMAPARLGDQLQGSSAEDATRAILALAEHHAAFWGQTDAFDFLVDYHAPDQCAILEGAYRKSYPPTLEAYAEHFTAETRDATRKLSDRAPAMVERNKNRPLTVCHGDFRADNVFYDGVPGGAQVAVCDWQISGRGNGLFDVAYHLTQSVTPAVRSEIERPVLDAYLRTLREHGIEDYSTDQAWSDYREAAMFALVYPVTLCGSMDLSNPRARALGEVFLSRSLKAICDLDAIETLDRV
jgi:hypothetical protein